METEINGLNVLSLFDGISCGYLALKRSGIEINNYYASEIEASSIKISKNNYNDIIHIGNVEKVEYNNGILKTEYGSYNVGTIDLLFGGSPCQSLSIICKDRLNLDGKSKLFFEYVRILNQVKPKYFLFENVYSMNSESMHIISENLGYLPIMIDSRDFSAQERKRYYWTNIPINKILNKCELVLSDILEDEKSVPSKYYYIGKTLSDIDMSKPVCCKIGLSDNIFDYVCRVRNPKFKSCTLTCGGTGGHHQVKVYLDGMVRKLTPIEYERLQTLPDNYTEGVSDSARYNAIGNAWTVDVIAHILSGINSNIDNNISCSRFIVNNKLL